MLRDKAAEDRTVIFFPRAFFPDVTPHPNIDYDQKVVEACRSDLSIRINIKVAKAVIVGDIAVGKTCLVNRFCHEVFDSNYKATIGVDFEVERFDILQTPFNLQIWDTAGQERFQCIAASYYRGAHVVIVVFDMSNIGSLQNTPKWLEETLKNNIQKPLVFLVGSKKDLISDAAYMAVEEQAIKLAKALQAEYWAVSSKTGECVQDLFLRIASLAFNNCVMAELEEIENENGNAPMPAKDFVKLHKDKNIFEIEKPKCVTKCNIK